MITTVLLAAPLIVTVPLPATTETVLVESPGSFAVGVSEVFSTLKISASLAASLNAA